MRFTTFRTPTVFALFVVLAAAAQKNNYPTPPRSMDPESQNSKQPQTVTRRIDPAQIQKEADDLARIAQGIPADVTSVRKGMLPKDVIEKLKQIEKLSKRLRTELNP